VSGSTTNDLLTGVRRWWWAVFLATALAGLTAFVVTSQSPDRYEAHTRLLVGPVNTDADVLRAAGQLATTYAELVTSQTLLDATIAELALQRSRAELAEAISAHPDGNRLLTISVADRDPELAATLANTLAARLADLAAEGEARPDGLLLVVDRATPGQLVGPNALFISLVVMLGTAVAAAFTARLAERLDRTVGSEQELNEIAELDHFGAVELAPVRPWADRRPSAHAEPHSDRGSAYRLVATKVQLLAREQPLRSLLIVPVRHSAGSGELASNIALFLSERSQRVVLLDANWDSHEVTSLFGAHRHAGLAELLQQSATELGPRLPLETFLTPAGPHLHIMPAGPLSRSVADAPASLLESLQAQRDLVVVAAAPVTRSPASLAWARYADATLLMVHRNKTTRDDLVQAVESLRLVGANVIGTVLQEGYRRSRPARTSPPVRLWSRPAERV
jgi:capsular polysaccharide biosynthesis protein/Mrp family chromosome partitioning ATPase